MEMKKKAFDENIYKIINGDSMKVLDTLEENSIDSVITDPPYGLTTITKRFGKENSAPAQFGKAVAFENRERNKEYKYIGIELDHEYCEISKGRIDYALNKFEYDMMQDIKQEEERTGQMNLFDIDYGD